MNLPVSTESTQSLAVIDAEKKALIKNTICADFTDAELMLFLYQAKRLDLDPLSKEIYAFKNKKNNKLTIQAGIDGFRRIAQRSGEYQGQLGPSWCGEDGVWKDVWLGNKKPAAAKVGVLRSTFKEPMWAVAVFDSYYVKSNYGDGPWDKMPEVMIAKCAEALALRKAFPNEFSGVYGEEEIEKVRTDATDSPPQKELPKPKEELSEASKWLLREGVPLEFHQQLIAEYEKVKKFKTMRQFVMEWQAHGKRLAEALSAQNVISQDKKPDRALAAGKLPPLQGNPNKVPDEIEIPF